MAATELPQRPRHARRWIVRLLLVLAILIVAAVALAPWGASRIAPRRIEAAAAESIQGSVKVGAVSVGWFSPLAAGPIRLLDPQGQQVALVEMDAPITLWRIVSERWWSARSLDLGTIMLTGDIDIVRRTDGTTNLDAALAPRTPSPTPAPSGGGGSSTAQMPSIKARLQIAQLDATIREQKADGTSGPELGVRKLTGPVDINIDQGSLLAKADLKAEAVAAGGTTPSVIALHADIKQKSASGPSGFSPGNIERATVELDATGIPSAIIDALGGFGGALEQGLGAASDVQVRIDGNLAAADIAFEFRSPGATADAALKLTDGVLVAGASGRPALTLNLKSTGFVSRLPQARAAVEKAAQNITLDAGPSLALSVDSLRLPVPAGLTEGKPFDAGALDLRGAGVKMTIDVGAVSGQVALPAPGAAGGTIPPNATRKPQHFAAEAMHIVVDASDLSRPVTISGGTAATLDGRSAGDLVIDASADGLLDAQGRLLALQPGAPAFGAVTANVALRQFASALLQPFVAAAGLPVDLPLDAGPTLDLTMNVKTSAPGATPSTPADVPGAPSGLSALPPADATITLRSSNLSADVAARLEGGTLRSTGTGIRAVMNSATPLARRILAGDGTTAPAIDVSGRAGVELTITDLVADVDELTGGGDAPLRALDGNINVAITDVRVTLPPLPGVEGRPPFAAAPIDIASSSLGIVLARGQAPALDAEAQATTVGAAAPMTFAANLTAAGLKSGEMPKATGLDMLLALGLVGEINARGVPPAILSTLPQLARYAPASTGAAVTPSALDSAIAQALAGAVGTGADVTINLGAPKDGAPGQIARIQVATQAKGFGSDLYLRLTPTEAAITGGTNFLIAEPSAINAVLAAASPPAEGTAAEPGAQTLSLVEKTKLHLRFPEPIVIPLRKTPEGAIVPDFAVAKDFFASLAAEGDIVIGGIPLASEPGGRARPEDSARPTDSALRLSKFEGQARVPLAALASDAAKADPANRATLKVTTDARTFEGAPISALVLDATAGLDASSPQVVATLAGINTANVDVLLRRNGLVTGALGETADISLRITPQAITQAGGGSVTDLAIHAELTSPTISGASISLAKRAESIALTEASNITWTPAPAFLNSLLAKDDNSVRITSTSPITITLAKLAIASGGTEGTGPLRPGVFDVDASMAMPRLDMDVPSPAAEPEPNAPAPARADRRDREASGGGPLGGSARSHARAVAMSGLSARIRWDSATPAMSDGAPGALVAAITIDGIAGTEGPAAKPSSITATIRSIADSLGNPTPDAAVVSAEADLAAFPSILLDQLAGQDGLLAEALGPTVSASATLRNVSMAEGPQGAGGPEGRIEANLTSPRATARIEGDIRAGQFVQSGESQARLLVIRPELVGELAGSLPLIASLEKTSADDPALLQATDLSIPLDKDLSKLSGVISIDPGVARFTTQSIFGGLLKFAGARDSGSVGRRIEPFVVRIVNGVATYDRFRLPLGEFAIETRGQINLVTKQVNLVAYVPFFALTDEGLGPIKLGLGGLDVLDRNTLVPITIKGGMGSPSAMVDVPLFLKETGDNLLSSPGKILEGLGDLLGGGKKEDKKPE